MKTNLPGVELLVLVAVHSIGATVIDLTHVYGEDVLYPPIGPGGTSKMYNFTMMQRGPAELTKSWLEYNWIGFFEHGGTHLDAPSHFAQGRPRLHAVPAEQLIAPGVMINVAEKAKKNWDYAMTIQDIEEWEKKNGAIPKGAIVMMNSGWHLKYPDRKAFYGTETPDDMSTHRHPGLHPDAANWLMTNRQIVGFGTDSSSCDIGQTNGVYPTHVALLSQDVLVFEMVANLDRMPATGSTIFVGALRIRDASGGPCRILAIYGGEQSSANKIGISLLYIVCIMLLKTIF